MANWKKVGKAWATGGASIAYDMAKERKAGAPVEEAPMPEGTTARTNANPGIQHPAPPESVLPDDLVSESLSSDDPALPTIDAGVTAQAVKLKKRVRASLEQNLAAGETIEVIIRGAHGQAIVGTASRVFVLKPGFMAGASFGSEVTSWSYRSLVGIQVHKGMVSGAVVIQAPGQSGVNTSYWGNAKDDPTKAPNAIPVVGDWDRVQAAVVRLRTLIDAAHTPEARPAAVTASMADEFAKLAELKASGILSDEEFAAAKQRLLGT
jgi:Short C-terminal domain